MAESEVRYGEPRPGRYQLLLRDVMDGSVEQVEVFNLEGKLKTSDPRDWPVTGPILVAIWEAHARLRAQTTEKLGGLIEDSTDVPSTGEENKRDE